MGGGGGICLSLKLFWEWKLQQIYFYTFAPIAKKKEKIEQLSKRRGGGGYQETDYNGQKRETSHVH